MQPLTRNITRVYRAATADQLVTGRTWYDEARALALDLTPHDIEVGAGVIAALSPLTSWTQNVRMATLAFHDRPALRGLGNSLRSADRIIAGEHPLTVLAGPKVNAFYRNILGDPDAVTVDRHAVDIALGRPLTEDDRTPYLTRASVRRIGDLYRRAADRVDDTPAHVQAVTWVAWRETRIRNRHAALRERLTVAA